MVHPAVFRHLERFAHCHWKRRLSAGPCEIQEWRANDTREGQEYPDVDRDAAGGRPGVPLTQRIGPLPDLSKAMSLV